MASSLRELRQRRKSVTTTKKITRAMELIAASRIIKAQNAARSALPYTRELTRVAYNYSLWSIWMQQSNFRKSAIRIRR